MTRTEDEGSRIAASPRTDDALAVGRVVDERGRPVSAAIDIAQRGPRWRETLVATTLSDPHGVFQLPCSKLSNGFARVRAPGFIEKEHRLTCDDGNQVTLAASASVAGRVVDDAQAPVVDATVSCAVGTVSSRSEDSTTSREDGQFILDGCPPGKLFLRAQSKSHQSSDIEIHSDDASGVTITMPNGRTLRGRVLDRGGQPELCCAVVAVDPDGRHPAVDWTSRDGSFALGIGLEEYAVAAFSLDGRTALARTTGTESGPIELTLPQGLRLTGRATGQTDGLSIRAVASNATPEEPRWYRERFWRIATRQTGTFFREAQVNGSDFTFESLEAGEFTLLAVSSHGRATIAVDTKNTSHVVIPLDVAASVRLRFTNAPPDLSGAVSAKCNGSGGSVTVERAEAQFRNLKPGPCVFSFVTSKGPRASPLRTTVAPGPNSLEWELPDAWFTARGTVTDGDSRAPIARVEVSTAVPAAKGGFTRGPDILLTDENGQFSFEVEEREALLFVLKHGYASRLIRASEAGNVELRRGESQPWVKDDS